MTFSSIFNPSAVHFDIKAAKKPSLIDCEGCGQAIKKNGGRKCLCSSCSYFNNRYMQRQHDRRRRGQGVVAKILTSGSTVLKMSHKAG